MAIPHDFLKKEFNLDSYLLDEELDLEVRDGGFKLGGVLLDVATEYSVPVVLVTVDGYTVAVLFWETDLYEVEVVEEDTELDVEVELNEDIIYNKVDEKSVKINKQFSAFHKITYDVMYPFNVNLHQNHYSIT